MRGVGQSITTALTVFCFCAIGIAQDAPSVPDAASAQWAGSTSCRPCHQPFYEKWATSHHGLAMQPFTTILAADRLKPLDKPIRVRDRDYRVEFAGDGGRVMEAGPEGEKSYRIEHVLGGKNVYYFLTSLERGRLQVLPVAFDVHRQEWLDTTGSAARGAMHIEEEVLDWRAPQLTFNTSCHGCHVSQFSSNYDARTDTYHSTWAEPGISCETCHGAGAEHVRLFRDLPEGKKPDDIKIISTMSFSVEQINAMCAPCHAKSMPLTDSFRPGERFFDNYDLSGPEDSDFYPDGRDLGENYTYTSWRMSPCVKAGGLSCMHCHTSGGRYRFKDDPNQACLPCHASRVENATAHTHHPPNSAGNHCVSCHMPTTEFARMRRSDHSMRPPMPAATLAFQSPNACNLCHVDRDAAWADRYVREWRTRDYQSPVLRLGSLIAAARQRDWARLPEMLAYLTSADRDEIFATALVRLVRACADERKWPALLNALKDQSPLVRASAAEALDGLATPETITALLAATGDEYRLVRVRAAATLAGLPTEGLPEKSRRDLARATDELLTVIQARPDDSASHHNLGNFHMARQEYNEAIACYERAFKLLPDNIAPLVNASLVYNALGANDRAEDCLRRALCVDPSNAAANLNLGLLLAEMGRAQEAEAALRAAYAADGKLASAAHNLAILVSPDRLTEAIEWSCRAAELQPQEPKYAFTLAYYQRQAGDTEAAVRTLQKLIVEDRADPDAYMLLGSMYEEQDRRADALDVYLRAMNNAQLPDAARKGFAVRVEALKQP